MRFRTVLSACVILVGSLPPFGSEFARSWSAPKPKRHVIRDVAEIPVGRQHDKLVLVQTAKGIGDNGLWRIAKTERNPLFAGRWFEDDIILLCLRWYFRFKLSCRDLVAILGERGLSISHSTILRWVVRYADTCEKRWCRFRGRNPVKIRCCQYLNNIVEQDHRRVKGRLRPMLGFKTFYNARRVIIGIELAQKIHKR